MIPRRRSARILQKITSESEASDINTDDELTSLTETPNRRRRKSLNTPSKSTVKKISKAEKVPETVLELVEETEDTGSISNISDKVVSSTCVKKSRRKIENVIDIATEDEDFSSKPTSNTPSKKEVIKFTSPLKSAEEELKKLDKSLLKSDDDEELIKLPSQSKSTKGDIIYHSEEKKTVINNNETVNIIKEADGYLFDNKVQTKIKKKPRFKVDLKKYEDNSSNSPLLKLGYKLKNSTIFKDHLQQIKRDKGSSPQKMIVNDICGLDGIQLEESSKEPKLETNLVSSNGSNLKELSEKQVDKLMKKSVLPPDMEKEKNCPVFNQSKYSKIKERQKKAQETAGPGWYNLPKTELTDDVKRDLQILKMRKVLDTKQHYKRDDSKKIPKFFQMGTIIEGSHEFYSGRMSKKERKRTMVDELLADSEFRKKNKKRMIEYEMRKGAGGKGYHKKKMQKRKPTKQRT